MKMLVRQGFTVVELLIVVVIIAILAIMTAGLYQNAQVQARDAQVRAAADKFADAILIWSSQNRNAQPKGGYGSTSAATATGCADGSFGFQNYQHSTVNVNYPCTVGDAMVAMGFLSADFFTGLPNNVTQNNNKSTFLINPCDNNGNWWILMNSLEDPTAQDVQNFDAILTQCGTSPTGYPARDSYGMRAARLLKFK